MLKSAYFECTVQWVLVNLCNSVAITTVHLLDHFSNPPNFPSASLQSILTPALSQATTDLVSFGPIMFLFYTPPFCWFLLCFLIPLVCSSMEFSLETEQVSPSPGGQPGPLLASVSLVPIVPLHFLPSPAIAPTHFWTFYILYYLLYWLFIVRISTCM